MAHQHLMNSPEKRMKNVKVAKIEVIKSTAPVFDITVEDNHNFITNGGVLSSNCYVLLDEAQNTSVEQMKMFVTRIGVHSQFVVNGDTSQSDLTRNHENGLDYIVRRLRGVHSDINVTQFTNSDVQRSEIVKTILTYLDAPDLNAPERKRHDR